MLNPLARSRTPRPGDSFYGTAKRRRQHERPLGIILDAQMSRGGWCAHVKMKDGATETVEWSRFADPPFEPNSWTLREMYEEYAPSVFAVEVLRQSGDLGVGTAFHIGDGFLATARHVVQDARIQRVFNTERYAQANPEEERFDYIGPLEFKDVEGPWYHPDDDTDVAVLRVEGVAGTSRVPLGTHLEDYLRPTAYPLREVLLMGYPPIPLAHTCTVATRAEVNAVAKSYRAEQAHSQFIVSSMPRGGFSGGPCMIEWGFALGMVTEALCDTDEHRLGFTAVLTVDPIYDTLFEHDLIIEEVDSFFRKNPPPAPEDL